MTTLTEDKIRVVIYHQDDEIGVMYYERAKHGYNNKPIISGWTCVDAKVDKIYNIYNDITPKDILDFVQKEIIKFTNNNN